jgi:tRNA modification GTPase
VVVNKNDLPRKIDVMNLNGASRVSISAKTGQGLDELRATLEAFLLSQKANLNDDLVLTHSRQYDAVIRAVEALAAGAAAARSGVPHEMACWIFIADIGALDELTGDVVTDDIFGTYFLHFLYR